MKNIHITAANLPPVGAIVAIKCAYAGGEFEVSAVDIKSTGHAILTLKDRANDWSVWPDVRSSGCTFIRMAKTPPLFKKGDIVRLITPFNDFGAFAAHGAQLVKEHTELVVLKNYGEFAGKGFEKIEVEIVKPHPLAERYNDQRIPSNCLELVKVIAPEPTVTFEAGDIVRLATPTNTFQAFSGISYGMYEQQVELVVVDNQGDPDGAGYETILVKVTADGAKAFSHRPFYLQEIKSTELELVRSVKAPAPTGPIEPTAPMTQKVLQLFRAKGDVTPLEAGGVLKCRSLPYQVFALKKLGHKITTTRKTDPIDGQVYARYTYHAPKTGE